MSKVARKQLASWSRIVAMSVFAGAAFSYMLNRDGDATRDLAFGAIVGALTSMSALTFETLLHRRLSKLPLIVNLVVRTVAHAALIFCSYSVAVMVLWGRLLIMQGVAASLVFGGSLIFLFIFVSTVSRMLGQKTLVRILTGRYYRPVPQRRIFMFLDIASSTTIAERIGDQKFHSFLNDFFFDITPAILESDGEIYQYVGDEVVVSWSLPEGIADQNCLRCYFRIRDAIERRRQIYESKHGVVPRFRAGLHCGDVVVGELGDFKKAIAFVGDTVNTTSRIQGECSKQDIACIVSGDLLEQMGGALPRDLTARSLGRMTLKGKAREVELFELTVGEVDEPGTGSS